jgi:hypothetical protein
MLIEFFDAYLFHNGNGEGFTLWVPYCFFTLSNRLKKLEYNDMSVNYLFLVATIFYYLCYGVGGRHENYFTYSDSRFTGGYRFWLMIHIQNDDRNGVTLQRTDHQPEKKIRWKIENNGWRYLFLKVIAVGHGCFTRVDVGE